MDHFIGLAVFVLPGVLAYFWIQAFGINPAVKHTSFEMGAIAALLWIPVSLVTISIYNGIGQIYDAPSIWTLEALREQSGHIDFLTWFSLLSIPVSFILSLIYARVFNPLRRNIVNAIRKSLNLSPFSKMPTVWEEFFIRNDQEKNEGAQAVIVGTLNRPDEIDQIGLVQKASRPFEPERALVLTRSDELRDMHEKHKYAVQRTYIDLKTGLFVSELDLDRSSDKSD